MALEVADTAELRWGEIAEVAGAEAVEDVDDAGLEEDGGLGVDEVESSGGTPAGDPVEGAFERGGPRSGEDRERIALGRDRLDAVVVGVVGHDGVDKVAGIIMIIIVIVIVISNCLLGN